MPLLLSIVAAAAITTVPECSWDHPGRDPYKGDIAAAVDAYRDIPPATRERLKSRLREQSFDDEVVITRDAISGREAYDPEIRGMHFGATRVCGRVSRSGWAPTHSESGRVVCEDGHCLLVPAVCGNVSVVHPARPRPQASSLEELPPTAAGGGPGVAAPMGAEPAEAVSFAPVPNADLVPAPVTVAAVEAPPALGPPLPWGGIPMPIGGPPRCDCVGIPSPVPEPSSVALFAGGLVLLALGAKRRRRALRG